MVGGRKRPFFHKLFNTSVDYFYACYKSYRSISKDIRRWMSWAPGWKPGPPGEREVENIQVKTVPLKEGSGINPSLSRVIF